MIGAKKIIGSPSPKTSTIPVPGSDVTLDFTEAFGGVHYNNRTITLVFLSLQPWSDQMAQDSTVKNALHGQKMNIVFSDDDQYYWRGRINVGDWEYYKGAGKVTVTIDAEPYKYKLTDNTAVWHHDTETTGDIVSFEAASASALSSCSVAIEPVQDLHGYDNPWPAGGGKNIMPYPYSAASGTYNGVAITVNNDGTVNLSGTASGTAFFNLRSIAGKFMLKAGSYIASGQVSGSVIVVGRASDNVAIGSTNINNGQFSISEDTEVFAFIQINSGNSVNGVAKPMIRLSSVADSTFAPYSNICPISGWTECKVTRTGINAWDEEWELGIWNSSGAKETNLTAIRSKNYIHVVPNTTYFVQFDKTRYTRGIIVRCFDADKNFVETKVTGVNPTTISLGADIHFITFCTYGADNVTTYNHDISINYPSTDTTYHAYQGQTYTIDLDGTRYGGTLDVTTGKLTVDRAMVDLGTLAWGYESSTAQFYSNGINGTSINWNKWSDTPPLLCSRYKPIPNALLASSDFCVGYAYNSGQLRVKDSGFTDAATFQAAMSGVQLVYELATPTEVDLTPAEIVTLVGQNHLWSDAGEISIVNPCVTIANAGGRNAIPQITNTAPATIKWGAYSVALSAGTDQQVPQLVIPNGGLKVDVASAADVTFKLTEASL